MIEFRQVTKRYSRFVTALDGINLTFERGEFAFITGPSGAGKSTLLKLLYAAERPTSGDVLVEGRSVARLHPNSVPYLRRNMGIVFQDFKLLPRRTILENVSLALEVCGVPPRQTRRRVIETIERVGLGGLERRLPGELSGGEQQRAVIARAIVGKPTIILADEPTGNLDESMSHDIFELISSICRHEGATILVATHDMAEVALWPFRQVRLWESRIEADRPALWQPWEHYPTRDAKGSDIPATDDLSGTGEAAHHTTAGEADVGGPIILNERLMPVLPDAPTEEFDAPITGPSQPEGDDDDAVEVSVEDSGEEGEEGEESATEAAVPIGEQAEPTEAVPQAADESQPDADKADGRTHLKAIAGGRSGGGKP